MIRRRYHILLLSLLSLLVCHYVYSKETNEDELIGGYYDNPVIKGLDAPDGCIWRDPETKTFYTFYSIQNDNSKHIYKSQDLVDWTDTDKPAFTDEDFHKMVSKRKPVF